LNGLKIDDGVTASPSSHNPFSTQGEGRGMGAIFGAENDLSTDGVASPSDTTATNVDSPSTSKENEADGEGGFDENGEFHPRKVIQRRTTHGEENAK
jgi:hypothetical protein